jgi:gluconolactonase
VNGVSHVEHTHLLGREPVGLDRLEMFAARLDHVEGIAIAADGTIYVGGEAGHIFRIGPDDTATEVANVGGAVLGLAMDAAGRIYACNELTGAVRRVDPATGANEIFTTGTTDRPMRMPNWGAFDPAGNYYVSDSGDWKRANGAIWVVRPGGRTELWSDQSIDFPNGLAVAPDDSRVYVLESTPGRIVEIPIDDDGSAGPRRVLCELGMVVPDGVAVADDGSLIIACYRPDAILRWHSADGVDVLAADPQGVVLAAPTNLAFAGDDLDLLVAANLGGWHLVRGRLGVRGTLLFRPTAEQIDGS